MDFRISEWISGFQNGFQIGFLDFNWISGFQIGFLLTLSDSVRDFFRSGPLAITRYGVWIGNGSTQKWRVDHEVTMPLCPGCPCPG